MGGVFRGRQGHRILPPSDYSDTGVSPTEYAFNGLWRASYAASPWVGTASAGNSLGNDAAEATNPPAAGAAVNGRTPASFDGTNDILVTDDIPGVMWGASPIWTIAALIKPASLVADDNAFSLPGIFSNTTAEFGMAMSVAGLRTFLLEGGAAFKQTTTAGLAVGTWAFAQMRSTGTALESRINGGSWDSIAGVSPNGMGGAGLIGSNYSIVYFYNGLMAELMMAPSLITNAQLDNIRAHLNSRYSLSL